MATLNPVVSKFTLSNSTVTQIYTCPTGKSYAIIDMTFFKANTTQDAIIAVALSSNSNPANLTSVDFFVDDIALLGQVNSGELSKVVVGPGEYLYVQKVSGPTVNVRVSGTEDASNTKVLKAGRLAAASISGTNQTLIYQNTIPNALYVSASTTIFNTSASTATITVWITSGTTPSDNDKVLQLDIPSQDTAILENVMLAPNEKIFVSSTQPNTEYFINGMVVSV